MPKGVPRNPRMSAEQLLGMLSPRTRLQILGDIASERLAVQSRMREIERDIAGGKSRLMDLNGRMMWYALTGDGGPLRAAVERRVDQRIGSG